MMGCLRGHPRARGFSAIELMVVIVIALIAMLFSGVYLNRIYEREKMKSAVREVHTLVLATRMQAIRRNQNVVLFVDIANRRVWSWADDAPPNFVQDPGEPTINQYMLPSHVVFRTTPGGPVDGPDTVAFDRYLGNAALVDRIVFTPDGTLVEPQDPNSVPPGKPSPYTADVPGSSVDCVAPFQCRGIFLADRRGGGPSRNVFRVSVDDFGRTGRTSILKWIHTSQGGNPGEWNFVPPPWKWVD